MKKEKKKRVSIKSVKHDRLLEIISAHCTVL